jgi:hypothetical protein
MNLLTYRGNASGLGGDGIDEFHKFSLRQNKLQYMTL